MITMCLLPKPLTKYPEKGRLTIRPMGSENNTAPGPASVSSSLVFISGMPLAQDAKVEPAIKKKVLTPMRCALAFEIEVVKGME